MPGAGDLDRRLRFERRVEGAGDGAGNVEEAFSTVCTVAASVLPYRTGNSEQVLAGRLAGTALFTVMVRRSSLTAALDPTCRAVDVRSAEIFNIRSVVDIAGDRAFLTMDAERGVVT